MTIITTTEELGQLIGDQLEKKLPLAIQNAANKPNPEKLYTRAQTARKLGKSKGTVKRMIDQFRLTVTTDGKYISQQAINDYITGQRSK